MRITDTIITILKAMVADSGCALESYQYNSKPLANVSLDRNKKSPTALLLVITDWQLDISKRNSVREQAEVNISFLTNQRPPDRGMEPVDTDIITPMASLAADFLARLMADRSLVISDDRVIMKSIYDRSDSTRSGVNLTLHIEERQGVCLEDFMAPEEETITEVTPQP